MLCLVIGHNEASCARSLDLLDAVYCNWLIGKQVVNGSEHAEGLDVGRVALKNKDVECPVWIAYVFYLKFLAGVGFG